MNVDEELSELDPDDRALVEAILAGIALGFQQAMAPYETRARDQAEQARDIEWQRLLEKTSCLGSEA